jgi:hypothetical protein
MSIEIFLLRSSLSDLLGRFVLEPQHDRDVRARLQTGRGAAGRILDPSLHRLHLGFLRRLLRPPFGQRLAQLVGGELMRRREIDHLLIFGDGGLQLAGLAVGFRLSEVLLGGAEAGPCQGDPVARAARFGGYGARQMQNRLVELVPGKRLLTLLEGTAARPA